MKEKEYARSIGSVIAGKRRALNLTQEQLGESIGIETESVSRLETGSTMPTLKRLIQLTDFFGCPLIDFFKVPTDNTAGNVAVINEILQKLTIDEQTDIINIMNGIVKLVKK